jgi:hypothetical protein
MVIKIETRYQLELSASEIRVLGLALAGKPLRGKDGREALELNRKIMQHRQAEAVLHAHTAQEAHAAAVRLLEEAEVLAKIPGPDTQEELIGDNG